MEFHLIRGLLQAGFNHVEPVEVNLRTVSHDPALKFEVGTVFPFAGAKPIDTNFSGMKIYLL